MANIYKMDTDYLSAESVYDRTLGKKQSEINSDNTKTPKVVLSKEIQAGSSVTYTVENYHVYWLICAHPYNSAYVAVIAGFGSGSTRITGLNSSSAISASLSSRTLTVSVASGATWVQIVDLGETES